MNRRDALAAGLLAVGLTAMLTPFARLGVDPHHDGIMLKPALDVLSGQVLFRDTFMQYGALSCYLQAAALWLQPTLLSIRLLAVAAYAVTLLFLYAAWREILPRSLTVVACGLFILFIPDYEKNWLDQYWMMLPWSSVFALMFESLGLYAMFRVIRGEQPQRWGLMLGLACACVLWCRQPVGVIMAGTLVVVGLALHWTGWAPGGHSKRSIAVATVGGFVAVNTILLGGIGFSGALPEWWYQNFVWPGKWAQGSVNVTWHDFVRVFVHPAAAAIQLVLLLVAAGPVILRRFRPDLPKRAVVIYFLCAAGVFVWLRAWILPALALREGGWTALFPVLILLQAVASIGQAFVGRGRDRPVEYYLVAAWAALSLGSLLQYYPVPDSWHLLWSLGPGFGLVTLVCWRWLRWPALVLTAVMTVAFLPAVFVKFASARQSLARPLVTLDRPAVLRGIRVSAEQARSFGEIDGCLEAIARHQPDLPAALIGNDAMFLCFVKNLANPTPYFVTWPGLADNADNRKRWAYIQRVRPLMFLHRARWEAVDDFYRRAHYLPVLYSKEEALEIALPRELADAMGLKAYGGAPAPAGPGQEKPNP